MITGQTAPVDSQPRQRRAADGLADLEKRPDGKILKCDASVAKNYLHEKEIKGLERIVSMYLDYAENQAARQIPMKMVDWIQKLDAFLAFNDSEILNITGKVSRAVAEKLTHQDYEKFRATQDRNFESDFDKNVKNMLKKND